MEMGSYENRRHEEGLRDTYNTKRIKAVIAAQEITWDCKNTLHFQY